MAFSILSFTIIYHFTSQQSHLKPVKIWLLYAMGLVKLVFTPGSIDSAVETARPWLSFDLNVGPGWTR